MHSCTSQSLHNPILNVHYLQLYCMSTLVQHGVCVCVRVQAATDVAAADVPTPPTPPLSSEGSLSVLSSPPDSCGASCVEQGMGQRCKAMVVYDRAGQKAMQKLRNVCVLSSAFKVSHN